jgi:hypothetical protein
MPEKFIEGLYFLQSKIWNKHVESDFPDDSNGRTEGGVYLTSNEFTPKLLWKIEKCDANPFNYKGEDYDTYHIISQEFIDGRSRSQDFVDCHCFAALGFGLGAVRPSINGG